MPDMKAIGIDGCRGGWIAVQIDRIGRQSFEIVPHVTDINIEDAMIMIDIPIGLPQSGYRSCDWAARKILGDGRSRVFLGARRPLLDFHSFADANAWGQSDGAGISKQLFAILPKIAQVDAFVRAATKRFDDFRECHPELVFHRLNNEQLLPKKKGSEGRRQRRDLLISHGFADIDLWSEQLWGRKTGKDDLYDACACALAAQDAARSKGRSVGREAGKDACGLPMEIWY